MLRLLMLGALTLLLAACGGSGGNSSDGAGANSISSLSISSSSAGQSGVPQNVVVVPGNASVTLSWSAVSGATSYRVYYASQANIIPVSIASFDDGTTLENVTAPLSITDLSNDKTYYFVVTAVVNQTESIASSEVSATPSVIDFARQPTAQEVLMVELINRARANPDAEALRYGIGLNDGITGTSLTSTPKQPLAHNLLLIKSARDHSQWMLDADIFDHVGINGSSSTQRMAAAGYVFSGAWSSGENISWTGVRGSSINLTNSAVAQHGSLFKSPGHRKNILGNDFREIGVGQKQGNFTTGGLTYLASMITQNFAKSGTGYFLTGVVFNDTNTNRFYDVGEGLNGISVTVNNVGYSAYATGAYSVPLARGSHDVTITGDAIGSPVFRTIVIDNANIKLDILKTGNSIEVLTQ